MFFTRQKLASIRAPNKAAPKPAPKKMSVVIKAPVVAKEPVPVKLPKPLPVNGPTRKITIKGLKASEPAKSAPTSNINSINLGNKKVIIKGLKASEPAKSAPTSKQQSNISPLKLSIKKVSI